MNSFWQKILTQILFVVCLVTFSGLFESGAAQFTTSQVEFTVRTTSPGGSFSPKNIGAIWVEDSLHHFVKTLTLWASKRKQYLYSWNTASSGNVVDAVTGATSLTHSNHSAFWNLKDVNGNTVPNGNYKLKIEMTDQHAQGPLAEFTFPVGVATDSLVPADQTYFHDMVLRWTSAGTAVPQGIKIQSDFKLQQNFPNPFNAATTIRFALSGSDFVKIKIYNTLSEEVETLVSEFLAAGNYEYHWNANALTSGVYFLRMETPKLIQSRKMVFLK